MPSSKTPGLLAQKMITSTGTSKGGSSSVTDAAPKSWSSRLRFWAMLIGLIAVSSKIFVNYIMKQTSSEVFLPLIPDQTGKLIVITGANSGIGLETTRVLALKGADIIMACRNMQACEAARVSLPIPRRVAMERTTCMKLDLSDFTSVRQFVDDIGQSVLRLPISKEEERVEKERIEQGHGSVKKTRKIDVLINNAGTMAIPLAFTAQGHEMQMGTNYLGHFLLTGLLLQQSYLSKNARIVNHSSMAALSVNSYFPDSYDFKNRNLELELMRSTATGTDTAKQDDESLSLFWGKPYDRFQEYSHSKRSMLYFSWELQKRLLAAGSKMTVLSVQPGYTATNLQTNRFPLWETLNNLVAMTPQQGAQSQILAATTMDSSILDSLSSQTAVASQPIILGPKCYLFGPPTVQNGNFYTLYQNQQLRENKQLMLWTLSVHATGMMKDMVLR